jgi:hypothetical protein
MRHTVRRRVMSWLLALLALALSAGAVLAAPGRADEVQRRVAVQEACAPGVALIGWSDALDKASFDGTDVGGLSALAWDATRGVYYALVDNRGSSSARVYTLSVPLDADGLGTPEVLAVTYLTRADGTPFTGEEIDAEGLALTPEGDLLVSSETEPSIRRFDIDGRLLAELPVPERFLVEPAGGAETNRALEGLAITPDGRHVFTANESPLAPDGWTEDGVGRIRILRYDLQPDGTYQPSAEHLYLTEPGAYVVELVAVSSEQLLVLERGFDLFTIFSGRVFSVSLRGAQDVSGQPSLESSAAAPLTKQQLADIAGCPAPDQRPAPMDNFEGMALGALGALLIISDDNFDTQQVTRLVALSMPIQPAAPLRSHPCGNP